jgi:hypothetical protein
VGGDTDISADSYDESGRVHQSTTVICPHYRRVHLYTLSSLTRLASLHQASFSGGSAGKVRADKFNCIDSNLCGCVPQCPIPSLLRLCSLRGRLTAGAACAFNETSANVSNYSFPDNCAAAAVLNCLLTFSVRPMTVNCLATCPQSRDSRG